MTVFVFSGEIVYGMKIYLRIMNCNICYENNNFIEVIER